MKSKPTIETTTPRVAFSLRDNGVPVVELGLTTGSTSAAAECGLIATLPVYWLSTYNSVLVFEVPGDPPEVEDAVEPVELDEPVVELVVRPELVLELPVEFEELPLVEVDTEVVLALVLVATVEGG